MRNQYKFFVCALFFALYIIVFSVDSTSAGDLELKGAGATFPQPFYEALFSMHYRQSGIKVSYEGVGSGEGMRRLFDRAVDFAGTDKIMEHGGSVNGDPHVLNIPTCVGAVAIIYNVPGNPKLRFTPEIIAEIYLGRITRWNDKRIAAVNEKAILPDIQITAVHRSDESGTTFIFSEYLSKTNKKWRDTIGVGKSVNWPKGRPAKGNPGVAGMVRQIPGAVDRKSTRLNSSHAS